MRNILLLVAAAVLVCGGWFAKTVYDQRTLLRQEAKEDGEAITRGIKAYWKHRVAIQRMENDSLSLKNVLLDVEIAQLQGHRADRRKVQEARAVVSNDKAALDAMDPSEPTLDSYQAEARITEHNRKYPFDPVANISDINRQMEKFNDDIKSVYDRENDKLSK